MVKGFIIIIIIFLFYLDLIQFSFRLLFQRPITANTLSTVFSLKDNTIEYTALHIRSIYH